MNTARVKHNPSLCLHKPTGQAYVTIEGRPHYLGKYGLPETQERYDRFIAEWLSNGRRLRVDPQEITVSEVCVAYLKYAEEYFVKPGDQDGKKKNTSQIFLVTRTIKPLVALYGRKCASDFGPVAARTVRDAWVDDGLSRATVRKYFTTLKALFRWAASHEMIPASVSHGIDTVEGLRAGRCRVKETEPVKPVSQEDIDAVAPFVGRIVWAMISLQLATAARPGEVCVLRPGDIDRSGPVWLARIVEHKNQWRGHERTLYIGPKGQEILTPFLLRPADAYCFSPRESERERYAKAATHRHQPVAPPDTNRVVGERYTATTYRRAIEYACRKAKIEVWSPNQLRHNAATTIRKDYGIEAAQLLLGHARADVTQVYAEVNKAKAVQVAMQIG